MTALNDHDPSKLQPRQSKDGVPIGYGLLAEYAAEPVEFSRLLQHLEKAHLVTHADRWPDTMPYAPAQLDEDDEDDDGIGGIYGLCWAIGLTACALAVGLTVAWLV